MLKPFENRFTYSYTHSYNVRNRSYLNDCIRDCNVLFSTSFQNFGVNKKE